MIFHQAIPRKAFGVADQPGTWVIDLYIFEIC